MKSIVLGGGCFWCIEAVFQHVNGVEKVISGYAGGDIDNPTYQNHGTHAEVVQIIYISEIISLNSILEIFFATHNPTTLNQQGNDVGEQYRSIILCAEEEIDDIKDFIFLEQDKWKDPIVTEIKVLDKFYEAEAFHQDYFNNNQSNPYCQVVINPKIKKLYKNFGSMAKPK